MPSHRMSRRSILQGAAAAAVVARPALAQGPAGPRGDASLVRAVNEAAEPLPAIDDPGFGALFDRFGSARVVLLGESTHGTSEFYRARAAITRRLIERHGFTIMAVEADWPDAAHVDAYIRGAGKPPFPAKPFRRFPTWMWRNQEVRELVDWMRERNASVADPARKAGFYGLDLYSLAASMDMVSDHLAKADPATQARGAYDCLSPYRDDPTGYGAAAFLGLGGGGACEGEAAAVLKALSERPPGLSPEAAFDALRNAHVVASAERYYRTAGSTNSWNLRDQHMFSTLLAVLEARGPNARAVVWAHNSHVGNAAATEMGERGELNIGELCRKHFGGTAALVGFGTDRGTVMAASQWDAPPEVKTVRPSLPDSYGAVFRDARPKRFLLDLRRGVHEGLREALTPERLERAIGVMYLPESERMSHYFKASLPEQFDAFLFFEETRAVEPIAGRAEAGLPQDHPFAG